MNKSCVYFLHRGLRFLTYTENKLRAACEAGTMKVPGRSYRQISVRSLGGVTGGVRASAPRSVIVV